MDEHDQDGTEKQPDQAFKSRPGAFGLTSKLNSQPKDNSAIIDELEDDEQKKNFTSKSALEKLLEEEERRQIMSRESTGSVIYDYDEPVPFPYGVGLEGGNVGVGVSTTHTTAQQGVAEDKVQKDKEEDGLIVSSAEEALQQMGLSIGSTTDDVGQAIVTSKTEEELDTSYPVVLQNSNEENQLSFTSESFSLDLDTSNHGEDYDQIGAQSDQSTDASNEHALFSNKLCETKNSLEIFQSPLNSTELPLTLPIEIEGDTGSNTRQVPKKKMGGFLRKLFANRKKSHN